MAQINQNDDIPVLSVLMPVYNTKEESLKESIKSILNQTFSDFELIILDDGSKDDILPIINYFQDNRIKFYKNEKNLGVSKTRNKLLDLAKGKYAAFQDADDISLAERFQKQINFLENNPEISAVSAWVERFPHKKIIENPSNPKILDFLGGCKFTQGCAVLRLEDFKKNNLKYNETLPTSEDYNLWTCAMLSGLKFHSLQEVLLMYRRENTSLCHTKGNDAAKADKEIKTMIISTLTDDKILQTKILNTVSNHFKKKGNFFENIFSIRNEWQGDKKFKIATILGVKFRLQRKTKNNV